MVLFDQPEHQLERGACPAAGEDVSIRDRRVFHRLTVAAFCVGRARRCFDHALTYAAERKQFGQQIAKFQGVSFQIADMITEIDAADWLTLAGAWRLDARLPANREIASAKLYASEMLARVTDTTLQIRGARPADRTTIVQAVLAAQAFVTAEAALIVEVEVNPLICTPAPPVAADALIRLGETT